MRVCLVILLLAVLCGPAGAASAGRVVPGNPCGAAPSEAAQCPQPSLPVYNPYAYVHTKDMLLVVAALSIITLAVSAATDDEAVIGLTYMLFSMAGLIMVPAAIIYDWMILLR